MYNSDLLDEYCEEEFGHTDWSMEWDVYGNLKVTFYKDPRPEYYQDEEEGVEE